jgi:hypothetical protein
VSKNDFQTIGQVTEPIIYDFPQTMIEQRSPATIEYRGQQKD